MGFLQNPNTCETNLEVLKNHGRKLRKKGEKV